MTSKGDWKWIGCYVAWVGGVFCGLALGAYLEHKQAVHNAVALGHAEWVAGEDGKPVFKWKAIK